MFDTRRREFITLVGGAMAWALAARAAGGATSDGTRQAIVQTSTPR
jgi:hypothetical protein